MTNTEYHGPTTSRPASPLVAALESSDPAGGFLGYMFDMMGPGEWHVPTDSGFWWIPGELRHDIEVGRAGSTYVCQSDLVLVRGVGNPLFALAMCVVFNKQPFGGVMWFDDEEATIHLTSSVHLAPSDWFNAFIFANVVQRGVGLAELLAPRLAELVGGEVATVAHPVLGPRPAPDQLVDEAVTITLVPEASTGLWWSTGEVERFLTAMKFFLRETGQAAEIEPDAYEEHWPSARSIDFVCTIPRDYGDATLTVAEADHHEFGFGLEMLLTTSVLVDGNPEPPAAPNENHAALFLANLINRADVTEWRSRLAVTGWSTTHGQLALCVFIPAEVARMLQQMSGVSAGDVLAVLALQTTERLGIVDEFAGEHDMAGVPWSSSETRLWNGVAATAANTSVLGELSRVAEIAQGLPVNRPLVPQELEMDTWLIPHMLTVCSMGIFNPAGPTVGTLEVVVDYRSGLSLLVERRRHPFSPSIMLHAVIDRSGFDQLEVFVEEAIAANDWSTFDWFDIRFWSREMHEAVERGLRRWATTRDRDFGRLAAALLETRSDPWVRLDPSGFEPEPLETDDPVGMWIEALTDPINIDNHVAHLRSAWEGAREFGRSSDGASAQAASDTTRREIAARGGVRDPLDL